MYSFAQSNWPFDSALTDVERATLSSRGAIKRVAAGAMIRTQESGDVGLVLLHSGEMRVSTTSSEGRRVSLVRLTPGEVCLLRGDESIGTHLELALIAEAESDCVFTALSQDALDHLLRTNDGVALWAYRELAARYGGMAQALRRALFWRLDRRVAKALLDAAPDGDQVRATQETLARDASSAREAVARTLRKFSDNGLVSLKRGKIALLNRPALAALVRGEERQA